MQRLRLLLATTVLAVTLTACGSSGTTGDGGSVSMDSGLDSESNSNGVSIPQAVSVSYGAMGVSLQAFFNTPVNENDLESAAVASASKLPQIRKDYDYFHLVVSGIASDEQLGMNGAPSLAMLQAADTAMGQWLAVREAYVGALSSCFGSGNNEAFIDCQTPIFAQYETQLVDTTQSTGLAIQAVDNAGQ
jgi:hypothetical protein